MTSIFLSFSFWMKEFQYQVYFVGLVFVWGFCLFSPLSLPGRSRKPFTGRTGRWCLRALIGRAQEAARPLPSSSPRRMEQRQPAPRHPGVLSAAGGTPATAAHSNSGSRVHKKYLSLWQSHSSGRFFFRWPLTSLRFFILFCKVSI